MEYSLSYCRERELNLNSWLLRLLLHVLGGFGHQGSALASTLYVTMVSHIPTGPYRHLV